MGIKENILELYKKEMMYIWSYSLDEGMENELILDSDNLCIELNDAFLNIHNKERGGDIEITISNKRNYISDINISYIIDITKFILDDLISSYYIEKMGFINMSSDIDKIICRALQIDIISQHYKRQNIFIYSDLNGLRIGDINKKNSWLQNSFMPVYGNEKWL